MAQHYSWQEKKSFNYLQITNIFISDFPVSSWPAQRSFHTSPSDSSTFPVGAVD